MAMDIQGYAGPQLLSDGAKALPRLEATGALVTQQLHGRWYESAKRGNVYHATTAKSGVAPGTDTGATAAFALYNPAGSGKDLVILRLTMGYISGTLGAGTVFACMNTNINAAAVTGTAITVVAGYASGQAGVGKPFTTATLPATPTIMYPVFNLQASLATTAVAPYTMADLPDGSIVVPPGCTFSLEGVTASGSTPLVVFGCTWEEVAA